MDASAGDEDLLVHPQELGMGEPFSRFGSPELGVGEGEPDLFHFTLLEIGGEAIDLGAEEGGIGNMLLEALLCSDVDTIAFEVDAQEIAPGIYAGQSNGVFAFSAGQLEGERVVVLKEPSPLSGHAFGILEHVGEGLYRSKTDQLFLAHLIKVRHFRDMGRLVGIVAGG